MVVICVSGILGNLAILAAIFLKQRATKMNCITANLVVFNVLCGSYQTTKSFFILQKEFTLRKRLCDHFGPTTFSALTGILINYFLITFYFYMLTFKFEIFKRLFTRAKTALFIVTTWLVAIATGAFNAWQTRIDKATSSITRCYLHYDAKGIPVFVFSIFIVLIILYANCRIRKSVHCWFKTAGDGRASHARIAIDLISIHVKATIWLGVTIACFAIGGPLGNMASRALAEKIKNVFYLLCLTNQLIYPLLLLINICHRSLRERRNRRRIGVGNAAPGNRPRQSAAWVVPRLQ